MELRRGQLYYADLSPVVGSEQGGLRPVLIIQNDIGNKYSPTTIVATITSKLTKAKIPTHVELSKNESGLTQDSIVLCEQLRTIDKRRLKKYIGQLTLDKMKKVRNGLIISLEIIPLKKLNNK